MRSTRPDRRTDSPRERARRGPQPTTYASRDPRGSWQQESSSSTSAAIGNDAGGQRLRQQRLRNRLYPAGSVAFRCHQLWFVRKGQKTQLNFGPRATAGHGREIAPCNIWDSKGLASDQALLVVMTGYRWSSRTPTRPVSAGGGAAPPRGVLTIRPPPPGRGPLRRRIPGPIGPGVGRPDERQ